MPEAVLITQCLQRDFVDPIGRYEPLPNALHVGHAEAMRLLGEDPSVGPLAQLLQAVGTLGATDLAVVHIRDWHDPADPRQADHLRTFKEHCLRGTEGARLVLGLEDTLGAPNVHVVDSVTLNDVEGTGLAELLDELRGGSAAPLRVGVIGVWTEAKVSFLLYELKTRLGIDALATCSALTASASRAQHFNALEQLERILGVQVFDAVGGFAEWLRPGARLAVPPARAGASPRLTVDGAPAPGDRAIVSHLFRESSAVSLAPLAGGFSGAATYRAASVDALGHQQAPSVVKVGPAAMIAAERRAFERVEEVLGNNAPSVRGFVELDGRAGIRFGYAAMGQGEVRTLKRLFEDGAPVEVLERVVRTTFEEVLAPFYAAARYERSPVFATYEFSSRWAGSVAQRSRAVLAEAGGTAGPDGLTLPDGSVVPDLVPFYERFLDGDDIPTEDFHYVSYVHGDLNAANVVVDARDNVWVIDFLHTEPSHVLKDLAKLENDLLYILTPLASTDDLREALLVTRALLEVRDLAAPLGPPPAGVGAPALLRAWHLLAVLREIGGRLCREDRGPLQLEVALLRFAAHTLSFEESSALQRCWSLAAGGLLAERIEATVRRDRRLRVDWLDAATFAPGRLGITQCPGRRDRGRDLAADLQALLDDGITLLVCLVTDDELARVGAADLPAAARALGLPVLHHPVRDQGVPTLEDATTLVHACRAETHAGGSVAVVCLGGLGRSGTLAACSLVERGTTAADAITAVRRARDPRALETRSQEEFVAAFAAARPGP